MRREDQQKLDELKYAPRYRKTATVRAELAIEDGEVETLEGYMQYKALEHYLVSDDPPTHLWPVRRDIFDSTYEVVDD